MNYALLVTILEILYIVLFVIIITALVISTIKENQHKSPKWSTRILSVAAIPAFLLMMGLGMILSTGDFYTTIKTTDVTMEEISAKFSEIDGKRYYNEIIRDCKISEPYREVKELNAIIPHRMCEIHIPISYEIKHPLTRGYKIGLKGEQ